MDIYINAYVHTYIYIYVCVCFIIYLHRSLVAFIYAKFRLEYLKCVHHNIFFLSLSVSVRTKLVAYLHEMDEDLKHTFVNV